MNVIYNEKCEETMQRLMNEGAKVDVIMTSPPYNTSRKGSLTSTKANPDYHPFYRYDVLVDNLTPEEYEEQTIRWFNDFDNILNENGTILYNISYGAAGMDDLIKLLFRITQDTAFSIADTIIWKKGNAMPNNVSPNRLTRITEYVFVFCRKSEFKTFNANKRVVSVRNNGQSMYENVINYVEARNNDGSCPLNKATYSSDLCTQLLSIYAKEGSVIYDPFMGTGTTAVACLELGMEFLGSELSEAQVEWSKERLTDIVRGKHVGKIHDYVQDRWSSDWNGDEVGFDEINVVGLYTMKNAPVDYYVDVESGLILDAWLSEH